MAASLLRCVNVDIADDCIRLPLPNFDYTYSSGVGSGTRFVDSKPFGYPFDRQIDEYDFFVPNGFFKDVKVYYVDFFAKYFEKKYTKFGTFDYSYFEY